jgi:hypothetical protein
MEGSVLSFLKAELKVNDTGNLKQELPVAAMFVNGSKRYEQSL